MKNLYHQLLLVIAGSTQKQLASQIQYLRAENAILRSKLPRRISVTPQEKTRLAKLASKLGKAFNELVTIVSPGTLRRWIGQFQKPSGISHAKKGRPRTPQDIRELIIRLARENDWGYTRILGELRKLGVRAVSRNTVKNILKENGLEPGPKRGEGTWDEFLKTHAATLWQCDFYAKKVLTLKGFRDLFLLIFLHVETRRVFIAPSTFHPNESWVQQQAKAFLTQVGAMGLGAKTVIHDRDTKFTASFDQCLESANLQVVKCAHRAPNTNAFVERFIQTLQQECLNYFIVFGAQHMDHLVAEMVSHYHEERPHQAKENELLALATPNAKPSKVNRKKKRKSRSDVIPVSQIECRQRLGGRLKHYYRRAA